ncbi:flavin monoamine oxidase family protein [Streptomyces thermodiastaticus]|uniref:flavin monoamine oxidase family protein n=1 Tax=Streptomyces thermodiastaticus TaxID=44061 RepID=UPI00198AB785|nr:NAD(P)/FAD-dependent oxidoreductase [Streptomyces thermodiastaticus]MCE7550797.1 FAD-dependent oxidoreductase [Streptomyces thermodiastaticus]GHF74741.1 putative flavin-containing monoamine oxidase AofH [Streptomyces thermodiastaticus]
MNRDRRLPQLPNMRPLSRRSVLKAGGLTALAATTATVPAFADDTASEATANDVIVIGAGYAGVTAARELKAKGLHPVILEARDRIGGRTWTSTFQGRPVELGAQWIGPAQPLVNAELKRYNIGTLTGTPPNRLIMPSSTGFKAFPPDEVDTRFGALMDQLFKDAKDLFPNPTDPLYRKDLVSAVDQMSLRDRLNQLRLSAEDESWLSGTTAGYSGGSSDIGAYTALAHWWSLAGYSLAGYDAAMSQRISGGMVGLLQAMLRDADAELHLNSPVVSVNDDGSQVRVTTRSGKVYTGRAAVVAVPVNVWKTISFTPGLPEVHQQATAQGVGVPHSSKVWMKVSGVSDRVVARGQEGTAFTTLLSQDSVTGGQLMVGFNSLPALNGSDRAAVEAAVRVFLPEATVVEVLAQDWAADPYALGGWALRRPGQLTAQLPAIQQPQGRVAFASGDIASGWVGFVEGAIESGLRAAQQVLKLTGYSVAA